MKAALLVAVMIAVGAAPCFALPAGDVSDPGPQHISSPTGSSNGSTSRTAFEKRIEADAESFSAEHPDLIAERTVKFDTAGPLDSAEYARLKGYGVLLLGAQAQDASELPLNNVYLSRPGGDVIVLHRIGSIRRELPPSSRAATIFGSHLEESFYILPVAALGEGTRILCDFARNRKGFPVSDDLVSPFPGLEASSAKPSMDQIRIFMDREYPGFGVDVLKDGR